MTLHGVEVCVEKGLSGAPCLARGGRPSARPPRIRGETLRDRLLRDGPMAPARACALLSGLLAELGAAHAAGIIHRDIKPANILLVPWAKTLGGPPERARGRSEGERCVLLDFGITRLESVDGDATMDVDALGTPRYLAPEQVLGAEVDARTDVYSAAIVLFEMIAGRSPYDGSGPAERMRAHLGARPRRLGSVASVLPELDAVIDRALERDPALRWPSARVFAVRLDRAAARERAEGVAR